mmetsp:Transcript_105889/g.226014  ORF Transcript_105889/g.226014 Transcript_105889/m.226014 type:complete len:263 (+) Transcript_105889:548-1336(+)
MSASEVHAFLALLSIVQRHAARQVSVQHEELVLSGAPLDVMDSASVRMGDDCGLAVRAHEVEVGTTIIALAGVVDLLRGAHQQRRSSVVPHHLHRLRLKEVLGGDRCGGIIKPVDAAPGRCALRLCNADSDVASFRGDLEGHDARRNDPGFGLTPLSLRIPWQDHHPVLHHAATLRLQAGPLQRGPRHLGHLLQDEREVQLACPRIPQANISASILGVALVCHEVVPKWREVHVPERPSDQWRDLAKLRIPGNGIVHGCSAC